MLKNKHIQYALVGGQGIFFLVLMAIRSSCLIYDVITTLIQLLLGFACERCYALHNKAVSDLEEAGLFTLETIPLVHQQARRYASLCCLFGLIVLALSLTPAISLIFCHCK